ncbi:MAG: carboxypeptidase regulatory-like domain-containing protein, partial [Candidatus Cloacimonetes bacterium]|nr:carboxypeptidase regulatory-like domain-containing protein [Candidatus Cloacimonadota bacterium]
MKYKKIMVVGLALLIASICLSAEEKIVVRFDNPDDSIVNEFTPSEYDVASYKLGKYLDLVITLSKYEELISKGYGIRITQTEEQLKNNLTATSDLNGYRDYDEMLTELQQIEIDYPNICKLYDIGDSQGKIYSDAGNSNYDNYYHEIWALKVSDNVETEEDEPCVYYMGEHHAREPISLEVTMAILYHILDNYGVDPTITDNVNNTQIWFVPLVNPNGHKIVTDEDDLWWRKNIRDNDEDGMIDPSYGSNYPDGVDPNRNYGFEWGYVGASGNWNSQTYHGPYAFSEPEVLAMKELMDNHHFVTGITYHSYGELVLFPFGYNDGVIAPDHDALEDLAVNMASTMGYTPQESWQLYPCMGTTDDYSYGSLGTFSFTIELATEFIPPAGQVAAICTENINAAMILLDRVNHSGLTGHITDADTGNPIQAEIFVEGVDNTGVFRYPYMSDEEFGRYYRLLINGTYDVTFSAYGYESQTINNVVISDDAEILDIVLEPSTATFDITGVVSDGDTGQPLEYACVEIIDMGIPAVVTNSLGEYTIPDVYEYTYDFRVYAEDHAGFDSEYTVTNINHIIDFDLYEIDDGTFENGVFGNCWNLDGNTNWLIDTNIANSGSNSARSGNIGDDQISEISISMYVNEDDEISFYRKVSSEANYDFFQFYIDGTMLEQWSGNVSWELETYPVTAGYHTFKWLYVKDGGASNGSDCGWIDD